MFHNGLSGAFLDDHRLTEAQVACCEGIFHFGLGHWEGDMISSQR